MDIRQQLQRLLDLTEEARQHALEVEASRSGALSELDAAEYDLKRLIEEISVLLPEGEKLSAPPVPEPIIVGLLSGKRPA